MMEYSHGMNLSLKRYSDDMLMSLSRQPLIALALNALTRGLLFTAFIQLISYASVGQVGTLLSIAVLALMFSFVIFSIDLIEKYWARERLRRR